jgi:hypothetical protein
MIGHSIDQTEKFAKLIPPIGTFIMTDLRVDKALRVLAEHYTRAEQHTGFYIRPLTSPNDWSPDTRHRVIEAWSIVRAYLGLGI